MAQNQDFNSLDELFKKTFDNLPDAPSTNGWDVPSEKVWQGVRQNFSAPASSGFSKILAAAAVLAVVAAAVYFFSKNGDAGKIEAPVQPTVEQPTAVQPVDNQTVSQPAATEKPAEKAKTDATKPESGTAAKPKLSPVPPVNSTLKNQNADDAPRPQQHDFKSPATDKPAAPVLPEPNSETKPARPKVVPRNHDELHKQTEGGN